VHMRDVEIVGAAQVIVNEIERGCVQRDVAQTYALALKSSAPFDAAAANRAIVARWSLAGLLRIKESAWSGRWRGGDLFPS